MLNSLITPQGKNNFILQIEWNPSNKKDELHDVNLNISVIKGSVSVESVKNVLEPGVTKLKINTSNEDVEINGHVTGKSNNNDFISHFNIGISTKKLTPNPYYISDHPESLIYQKNVHQGLNKPLNGLKFNSVYWQDTVTVNGIQYFKVLGMSPPKQGIAEATFSIPEGSIEFKASIGFAADNKNPNKYGEVSASVYVDDIHRWSYVLFDNNVVGNVNLKLLPENKTIKLTIDSRGSHYCDQSVWIEPCFE